VINGVSVGGARREYESGFA